MGESVTADSIKSTFNVKGNLPIMLTDNVFRLNEHGTMRTYNHTQLLTLSEKMLNIIG